MLAQTLLWPPDLNGRINERLETEPDELDLRPEVLDNDVVLLLANGRGRRCQGLKALKQAGFKIACGQIRVRLLGGFQRNAQLRSQLFLQTAGRSRKKKIKS